MKKDKEIEKNQSLNVPTFFSIFLAFYMAIKPMQTGIIYPFVVVVFLFCLNLFSTRISSLKGDYKNYLVNIIIKMVSVLISWALITNSYTDDIFVWWIFCLIILIISTFAGILWRIGSKKECFFNKKSLSKDNIILFITLVLTILMAFKINLINSHQDFPIIGLRLLFTVFISSASINISSKINELYNLETNINLFKK
jgi:hypothetical protein